MTKALRIAIAILLTALAFFLLSTTTLAWVTRSANLQAAYNQGQQDLYNQLQAQAAQNNQLTE